VKATAINPQAKQAMSSNGRAIDMQASWPATEPGTCTELAMPLT